MRHADYKELPTWVLVMVLVVIPIIFTILWFIYYNMTKFTKVIKVADKFMKTYQVGGLHMSSNHFRQRTSVNDTRQTVEEYFLLDAERNLYSVEDCLFCGLYAGKFGKYSRILPGDTVEIMGYGGLFGGIPYVFSVRRLN